jgi:uncharacterized protein (TIGR02117 family)
MDPNAATGTAVVYVIGRGWHTDIGLPAREITGPLAKLEQGFPGVQYLVLGFGDRHYLLTRDKTFGDMLLALLPGRGAMLVTALRAPPQAAFGTAHVVALHITQIGLERLTAFLWASVETGPDGNPVPLGDGPYPGSTYYASAATYDVAYTCNTWTADALRAAGLPVRADGVLFAGQVMDRARQSAAMQAALGED